MLPIRFNAQFRLYWPGLFFISLFIGCSKSSTLKPIQSKTSIFITRLSPDSGKFGVIDTIEGGGFSGKLSVEFNKIPSSIIKQNDSLLIAIVPKESLSGYVTIKKGNQTIQGPLFYYIPTVTVSTLAGSGIQGFTDGPGWEAAFDFPRGLAIDPQGDLFVADFGNFRIRKVSPTGVVSTFAGSGIQGYRDGPASQAEFSFLTGIAMDQTGTLYVADGTRIRKILNGIVSTVAGNNLKGDLNGFAQDAEFNLPFGILKDSMGNIILTDPGNNDIRTIVGNGLVSTLSGGNIGYNDGIIRDALFDQPGGITIDKKGNLFIADAGNFRIREISISGVVSTYAGDGNFGFKNGRYFQSEFEFPTGIAVDSKGNLFVCGEDEVIREITINGDVSTIAGTGEPGLINGNGNQAKFNQPLFLLLKDDHTLFVSDQSNHCIREITFE